MYIVIYKSSTFVYRLSIGKYFLQEKI